MKPHLRVLVVDDKEENIYYLGALLSSHDCEVISARHGAEALILGRQSRPDLVVSDLLMPVMDGYTLLRLWKCDPVLSQTPFIVYTATYTEPDDERLALSLGADAFILKPCEPDQFITIIERVVDGISDGSTPPDSKASAQPDEELLQVYNQTLIRKLEAKTLELEQTNIALQQDIAAREKAESELRWKSAFLEAQVNSSLDGILVVDSQSHVILQNQRMLELWNIPPEIEANSDPKQIEWAAAQTTDPAGFTRKVMKLYSDREAVSRDEIHLKNGIILDRFSAPVKDPDGTYYGRIWTFRDVTQERTRERKLTEALARETELAEEARAGDRAKSEFLAVMSHEIRTPLNGILGFAELLAQTPNLPEDSKDSASIIASSGEALLHVLDDILDFSRLEAGRLQIESVVFDPKSILESIRVLLAAQAAWKSLEFRVDVHEGVPPFLRGDPGRVRQILLNLAGNAIKFTETGSVILGIQPGIDDGFCEFYVQDTGPGIAKDQVDRIFRPFTQVDSSISRRFGGTGLGLAISRRLAELMNGTLTAVSEAGTGARLLLRLPLSASEDDRPPPTDIATIDLSPEFAARYPLNILVVEDDKVNLKLILALIRRLGYEPLAARNGREAVDIHRREHPTCILMDLQMPEMDGIEATEQIRALERAHPNHHPTYITAVTANIVPADRQRCFDAGMNNYLNKPIQLPAIAAALVAARSLCAAN